MRYLLVLTVCMFTMASEALAERRVALVIGNATYQTVQALDNPENDASAVAKSLESLGFEVLLGLDLDQRGMQKMVREYSRMLIGSDVALFYYAGHGIQVSGRNYLIPIDADLQDETDLNFSAVDFDLILGQMEREPRVKLLFLDACRDNPFKDKLARSMSLTRSNARVDDGLAKISVDSSDGGTLIAFATDPGAVALDGSGQTHSPFTKALLEHIETPGLEIHSMMIDVRSAVWERTHKRQRPWSNSSLTGKFFFNVEEPPVVLAVNTQDVAPTAPEVEAKPKVEPEATPTPGPQANAPAAQAGDPVEAQIELEFWRAASEGNSIDEYLAYMDQFPKGRFTMIAAARIERLKSAAKTKGLTPITGTPTAPQPDPALGATQDSADPAVAAIAPEAAEQAMNMNRSTRRELQHRLKLAGFNPGGADGVLGPNSRAAISGWQTSRQLSATGYMTEDQLATLRTETEPGYQQLLTRWAAQQQARKQRKQTSTSTSQPRQAATPQEPKREGSHLGKAFRKIGHGVRDIFR